MSQRSIDPSRLLFALLAIAAGGCSEDSTSPDSHDFLEGTSGNPQIGLVINSTGKALTLFQLGKPDERREIPFGASSAITPIGLALRGGFAAVPLGDAASTALVNLAGLAIDRYFTFAAGNATGVAFVNDSTLVVANLTGGYLGRAFVHQASDAITDTVSVAAPSPSSVVVANGLAFVVSGNLDGFTPIGNGIVTVINPATMAVVDTIELGGENSSASALGPDGMIYVVNTGDYVADGSVTVINPTTREVVDTYEGFGAGPGSIRIDLNGLAYISGVFTGTVVWNTVTHGFVRGPDDAVCARLEHEAGTPCRGAFDTNRASDGSIYQVFFGSPADGLPPYLFVFSPTTYALTDSIPVGVGPSSIEIGIFGN